MPQFPADIDVSSLDGSTGFKLSGAAADDISGYSVASAGDVNGDGFADLIVGAPGADPHGTSSGASYVVFGQASGFAADVDLSTLDGTTGFKLSGAMPYDGSGNSVASAGDVNGDGFADLIIGAPNAAPYSSGSSYVVFGRAPDSARRRVGSAANQYISGGPFDDTLKGGQGQDVLEGRGGADSLIGGFDIDTASYLHPATRVRASLANPAMNTGDAAGESYATVENLTGSHFADRLTGNENANRLTGGLGPD